MTKGGRIRGPAEAARGATQEPGEYEVGYGKPPQRTKFRKGASGNPGGRPRGMTIGRANRLALEEAYRMLRVKEGDSIVMMPAIQVIMRAIMTNAAKGSGPAQRTALATIQAIERELEAQAAIKVKAEAAKPQMSDIEAARHIAFLFTKAARAKGHKEPIESVSSMLAVLNKDP